MWSKRGEEVGNSQGGGEMLWVWREGTQEVGVSKEEKTRGSSAPTRGVGESEGA